MPTPTVPQSVAILLPFAASSIASWLSHDRLPGWANALIALFALVGTAIGAWLLAGNFTGNVVTSVSAVLLYVGVLMQGQLQVLQQFLTASGSPLVRGIAQTVPASASAMVAPSTKVLPGENAPDLGG
jgi:hypothetical protein